MSGAVKGGWEKTNGDSRDPRSGEDTGCWGLGVGLGRGPTSPWDLNSNGYGKYG